MNIIRKKHKMRILFIILSLLMLDSKSLANQKQKIMFIVHTETINGKGVLDFYKILKSRNHEVKIVAAPLLISGNKILYDLDVNFAKKFNASDVFYPCGQKAPYTKCSKVKNYKPDIVFIQNPYNSFSGSSLDPDYTRSGLKKMGAKIAYVVYGPHVFHQATCNDKKLKETVDFVFVDSESTAKIFREQMGFDKKNVIVSGYQGYKNARDLMAQTSEKKTYKETLLWMPRWTLHFRDRDLHEGGSTFLSYYRFFIRYAKDNPNTLLIVRPHVLLFKHAIDAGFLSEHEVATIEKEMAAIKNIIYSKHIDTPLANDVVQADIVISDGTSALGEVVAVNKPIIYLSNGWNNEFNSNDLGKELKEFLYFAHDPQEVLSHLATIRSKKFRPFTEETKSGTTWEQFQKKLDPVNDPALFIAEWLEKQ